MKEDVQHLLFNLTKQIEMDKDIIAPSAQIYQPSLDLLKEYIQQLEDKLNEPPEIELTW